MYEIIKAAGLGARVANVFISYARGDRDRIQPLVAALEADGLSVWWDPALVPGRRFREMIAHELASADSVVVVWTRQALESDWVQDEAEEARVRGVLIPVVLEPVKAPAGFRQVQAADLSQWTGSRKHPEYKALIRAAKGLVALAQGGEAAPAPDPEPDPTPTPAPTSTPTPPPAPDPPRDYGLETIITPPKPKLPDPPKDETIDPVPALPSTAWVWVDRLFVLLARPAIWLAMAAYVVLSVLILAGRGRADAVVGWAFLFAAGGFLGAGVSRAFKRRGASRRQKGAALAGAAVGLLIGLILPHPGGPIALLLNMVTMAVTGFGLVGLFSLMVNPPDPTAAPAPPVPVSPATPKAEPPGSASAGFGERMVRALSHTRVWGGLTAYMVVSILILETRDSNPKVLLFLLALAGPLAGLICRALVKRGLTRASSLATLAGAGLGLAVWLLFVITNAPHRTDEILIAAPLLAVLLCLAGVIVFGLGSLLVVVLRQPAAAEK